MTLMFQGGLLRGKRILITGGGSGLGREMADEYLRLGAEVYICGRRKSLLEETARDLMERHGGTVKTRVADIRVAAAVDEMVESIFADGGPLTGLVNNAAGNFISPTKDLSSRGFDAIAASVFHGTFYVTLACGKRWIESGVRASVISMLVTWVRNGSPFTVPSAMSKAGIHIMTKSLAAEWARYGIRLNAMAPGVFPTKGAWERLKPGAKDDADVAGRVPMGRVGQMDELKNLAAFLMADGCEYLTGECIAMDGACSVATGGNFYHLASRTEEEWGSMRKMIRAATERDRKLASEQ